MLALVGRVRRIGYDLASLAKRRVASRAAGRVRCMMRNASPTTSMMMVKRRISSRVDFDNPATQLLEENESAGYKVYYQYGLPTRSERNEYDDFNDQVWYGRVGEEITYKILGLSADTQHCDLFLLRDYHTHRIIGCNAIKRASCSLSTLLHSNAAADAEKTFNYVIRRNTTIAPELQGKGLGKVVRKYSKYLDELHVGSCGLSVTDVQVKNVASYNLQIRSGFEVVGKTDSVLFFSSGRVAMDSEILRNYDMYTIAGNNEPERAEFEQIVALHRQYLSKHRIIDLSACPHDIDRNSPLYVIRHKESRRILLVMQPKPMRMQLKAANKLQEFAIESVAKLAGEPFQLEQDLETLGMWTLYMEEAKEHQADMAKCVKSLIKYSLQRNGAQLAMTIFHSSNPFGTYMAQKRDEIFGMIGSLGYEKENANILMRFEGLDEEQKNVIRANPVLIKMPVPLF